MKGIAEYRVEKGFTQQELAKLMELGLSTYQQKEQGKIGWMLRDLIKIRRILDVRFEGLKETSELELEMFKE